MDPLLIFSAISVFSLVLLAIMVSLKVRKLRLLDQESLERLIADEFDFFNINFSNRARIIFDHAKRIFSHPSFLKFLEIFLRRARIFVLKIERSLLKMTDYLRGKRQVRLNHENSSQFMKDINEWKNGNKNKPA